MVKCPSSTSTITLCRTSPKVPIWMASAKLGNLPTRSSDSTAKKYPGHILLILSITQYCTYYSTPSGNSGIPTSLAEKKKTLCMSRTKPPVIMDLPRMFPLIFRCSQWFSHVPMVFPRGFPMAFPSKPPFSSGSSTCASETPRPRARPWWVDLRAAQTSPWKIWRCPRDFMWISRGFITCLTCCN